MRGLWLLGVAGCGSLAPVSESMGPPEADRAEAEEAPVRMSQSAKLDDALAGMELQDLGALKQEGGARSPGAAPKPAPAPASLPAAVSASPAEPEAAPDLVRDWFPEAFLWAPLVETNDEGVASVEILVPDSLTTWRVLGLAHSREGQQAGTVFSFDSTLPRYIDPVVPGWLVSGDRVELPLRIVNNSDEALDTELSVRAAGALDGGMQTRVRLPPYGSEVYAVSLNAVGSGTGTLSALLGDDDAVEREVPVSPAGKRISQTRGGLLSGPRSFQLPGPTGADPATQRLVVHVFPGPLALLQQELERLDGSGSWSAEYGFALSQAMAELAAATGAEVEASSLRKLRLQSWQRLSVRARAPSAGDAVDVLAGMGEVEGNELVDTLKRRLVRVAVGGQRADGTWARQQRGPLQQVLIQTALAARGLPTEEEGARLRANGAIERFSPQIEDPFTAAVVLASGLVPESQREGLENLVIDDLVATSDGTRTVPTSVDALNAWGTRPSLAERRAWVALALAHREDLPWRGDFVSQLLESYDVQRGFGAGPAEVYALEAVVKTLPSLQAPAEVRLELNGYVVARSDVDPKDPTPAPLLGEPRGSNPRIDIESEASGLSFRATLDSWVPWADDRLAGVDVELQVPAMVSGRKSRLVLEVSAPSGVEVSIEQPLPAGMTASVALPLSVVHSEVLPDRVKLRTRPFGAGEVLEIPIDVVPTFAGRFQTSAVLVEAEGQRAELQPTLWTVR